jgi:hypothetical protein
MLSEDEEPDCCGGVVPALAEADELCHLSVAVVDGSHVLKNFVHEVELEIVVLPVMSVVDASVRSHKRALHATIVLLPHLLAQY